jgi:hypothetical protein
VAVRHVPLRQGFLPAHERYLEAAKQSDLSWGGDVQIASVHGGCDPPEGLGCLSEGRLCWGTTSDYFPALLHVLALTPGCGDCLLDNVN